MKTELSWIDFKESTPPFKDIFLASINGVVSPCLLNKIDANGLHVYCYKRRKTISSESYNFQLWCKMPDLGLEFNEEVECSNPPF